MVRGKEARGGTWGKEGARVKQCVKTWWSHWRQSSSCPCNYSQSEMSFASGMMDLINVTKWLFFRECGSQLIHLSTTIIDCLRCARSGLLGVCSLWANIFIRPTTRCAWWPRRRSSVIVTPEQIPCRFCLWGRREAPWRCHCWKLLECASSLVHCDAPEWLRLSLWNFKAGQWRRWSVRVYATASMGDA